MENFHSVTSCRVCGNSSLELILDLGEQALTGVFPAELDQKISTGPLRLVRCVGKDACGLVQLEHSFDLSEMYGMNYGYRSGLNPTMVTHLENIVKEVCQFVNPDESDIIIDIGCNDGTLLKAYPKNKYQLVGIDPTARKFASFYPPEIKVIPAFFPSIELQEICSQKGARIITSISMFYDLEDPQAFCRSIESLLADDGVWVFEQSYLQHMVDTLSFDTICHEHLEFYGLRQIDWLLKRARLRVTSINFNDVNGGSVRITACKESNTSYPPCHEFEHALKMEESSGLHTRETWTKFSKRLEVLRKEVLNFLTEKKEQGKLVIGLGASTKGNVLLQYFNIGTELLPFIAEVNPDKFHHYTPGTNIPIIPEADADLKKPDFKFVLPWHFRDHFIQKESSYLRCGGSLVFPLPKMEIYKSN